MGQERSLRGPVPDVVHRRTRKEVQPVAVRLVPRNGQLPVGGTQPHDRLEEDPAALLNILPHGVQVCGKLHTGGEQALAVLSLALAVELLPPLRHKPEGWIVAAQNFNGVPGPVQLIPQSGILPCGTIVGAVGTDVHHLSRALHQGLHIHTGNGDGQQTHGGKDGIAAADVIRHHKGLPALGVRQRFQRTPGLIGGGVDALAGFLLAVFLLQQLPEETECHGRLRGGTGFGDDIHGEIHIPHQIQYLAQCVAGETVAHKVHVGRLFLFQVIIGRTQAVDHAAGSQIAAADADDHQCLRIALDLLSGSPDPGKFLPVIRLRQMHPTGKFSAQTGAGLNFFMGFFQTGQQCLLVRLR